MALHWDLTGIENHKELCWITDDDGEGRMNPLTDYLIWTLGLSVGFPKITKENLAKLYSRLCVLWELHGPPLQTKEREPYYPSKEEVAAHIGMKTNGMEYNDLAFAARSYWVLLENGLKNAQERGHIEKNDPRVYEHIEAGRVMCRRLDDPGSRGIFNYDLRDWLEDQEYTEDDWPHDVDEDVMDKADQKFGKGWLLDVRGWPMIPADEVRGPRY